MLENKDMKAKAKKWRDFKLAREWARTLGLMTDSDWRDYRKKGLPDDIPSNPDREYKNLKEWVDMRDFLGNPNPTDKKIRRASYLEAQKWAVSQGIKTQSEWRQRCKQDDFPQNIYKAPNKGYAAFTSWPEFLKNFTRMSTRRTSNRKSPYRGFEEAKAWARSQPVLSASHWQYLAKKKEIPTDIPTNLKVYPEYRGSQDFFGNKIKGRSSIKESVVAVELGHFFKIEQQAKISIQKFEKYVDILVPEKNLIIEYDGSYWHANSKKSDGRSTGKLERNGWKVIRIREKPLPRLSNLDLIVDSKLPEILICKAVVKHLVEMKVLNTASELSKARDYLSNDEFKILKKDLTLLKWLPFEKAHEEVLKLELRSETEWRAVRSSLPENIPRNPNEVYFYSWKGWGHWLGTGNKKNPTGHLKFGEARRFVRSRQLSDSRDYQNYRKKHPNSRLPSNPATYYSEWKNWMDWLGTEKTAKRKRDWIKFEEAVEIARKLKLSSEAEWRELTKNPKNFPKDLPKSPDQIYGKRNEWRGWPYFLKG